MTSRDEFSAMISAVHRSEVTDFPTLVRIAGLDPKRDFRYARLDGVDFSNADIRGFDFTGASLEGCRFEGAFIRGTRFRDARLDWSRLFVARDWLEAIAAPTDGARARPDPVAVPPPTYFHLHLVSDATGEILATVARAASAQYVHVRPIEHLHPMVRSQRQMQRVIADIERAPGIVLCSVVNQGLHNKLVQACRRLRLPLMHVLVPIMKVIEAYLGAPQEPAGDPHSR